MSETTWERDLINARQRERSHKLRTFYPEVYEEKVREPRRKADKARVKRLRSNPDTNKWFRQKNTEKQMRYHRKRLADPETGEEYRKKQNEYKLKSYYKKMADPERAAAYREKRREYMKRRRQEKAP